MNGPIVLLLVVIVSAILVIAYEWMDKRFGDQLAQALLPKSMRDDNDKEV